MKGLGIALVLAAAFAMPPSAIGQDNAAPAARPLAAGQSLTGELSANDAQRRSGKYEDVFTVQGRRGERIDLRLISSDFDPLLVVSGPGGFSLTNDDEDGQEESTNSRLVIEFPADGAYRVGVSSFRSGETGSYRLQAERPAANVAVNAPQRAVPIRIGQSVNGRLAEGDGRRASGEYSDHYRFTARRGERVRISLTGGEDMDTYLMLQRPDGSQDANDDSEENGQPSLNSRLDTVLAEDGDYVIVATTYRPNTTGDYRLSLERSPGLPRQIGVRGGPRVVALLVGVSDYGERINPLSNTDADARELYNSLRGAGLLHPASQLLVNEQATTKNVAQAFERAAAAAGPDDLFLFFFSGHGAQVDVPVSAAELDGRAETIELYDAALSDAQLAPLFRNVRGRMSMLVIDACFAGGFRSLIDRPGVMGLFSSEEDLTSLVADRFKAGGFLSYFLRGGLSGGADEDGDRIVTAGELSTYVRRRFRREGDIPAQTREDAQNYQNLLVERGGIHVDDVVVRLASAAGAAMPQARQAPVHVQTAPAGEEGGKRRTPRPPKR
ncbi:MAG TPA: pre-peptidase C-terminal domain-containing protein [Allosphingosinicella sp.]|nr:pre-peptidase C-terminal domain-containing protein [Allosphingosinicella sp.]